MNFGTSLSRSYIGNSFQVQLADCAGTQPRLTYLSYTQTLLEDRMSFRVGRLTLNSVYGKEFMGSEYFKSFTSIGFDLIPEGVFLNVSGAAGYPRTTWGTRLRYSPTKRFYAQAGGYNADTQQLDGSTTASTSRYVVLCSPSARLVSGASLKVMMIPSRPGTSRQVVFTPAAPTTTFPVAL